MNSLYYYIIIVVFLVIVTLICKFFKIKNLKLFDWISLEFLPADNEEIKISTKSKFGIVVSSDGKIYKAQLETLIRNNEISAFCNASLFISGIGWMVYRQQFQKYGNNRAPRDERIILDKNIINDMNIEFEPKEGWEPMKLREKEYKCLLSVKTIDKTIKHKFIFQVRSQNIQAMHSFSNSHANVIEVPIIKN